MYKGQNIQNTGWILYENEDAKKSLLFTTSLGQVQILNLYGSYLGVKRKPCRGYLRLLKLKFMDILSFTEYILKKSHQIKLNVQNQPSSDVIPNSVS